MSNQLQEAINVDMHNPVRNYGIPQNPIPQTNTGLLEHSSIPFEPQEQITDIPPTFSWMVSQYKYIGSFTLKISDAVGTKIGDFPVLAYPTTFSDQFMLPNWQKLPFASSTWWNGMVSYRFTIIKPPRVVGKLLIRYRQDEFGDYDDQGQSTYTADATYRSILKEWDLAESNQFEFDIAAVLPIRARPCQDDRVSSFVDNTTIYSTTCYTSAITPWILNHMGGIRLEVAQMLSPGNLFPDSYTILVEKAFKNTNFMTPLDSKNYYRTVIDVPLPV